MRLAFCFSRSCKPYPTILALRSLPCCPGAKLRFSTGHLSLKHLVPFRNNFMPSRRQRRQTGPLYLAIVSPKFGVTAIGLQAACPSSRSSVLSFRTQFYAPNDEAKLCVVSADGIRYAESASRRESRALPTLRLRERESPILVPIRDRSLERPASAYHDRAPDSRRSSPLVAL